MAVPSGLSLSVEKVPLTGWEELNKIQQPGANTYAKYSNAILVGGFIFIGGHVAHFQKTSVLPVLDVRQETWRFIPCEGAFGQDAGLFLYDDSFYSLGSRDYRKVRSGKVSRFDLAENEWSICHTTGEGPGSRSFFVGHFLESFNRYVVFGGDRNSRKNGAFLLDMPLCRWLKASAKGSPPQGRVKAGSCVYKGVIYIFGGLTNGVRVNDGLHLLTVGRGKSVTWSTPRTNAIGFGPRSSFTFFPFGGVLLMCGGFPGLNTRKISSYDPDRQDFRDVEIEPKLLRLFGFGACHSPIDNGASAALFFGLNDGSYYIRISVHE